MAVTHARNSGCSLLALDFNTVCNCAIAYRMKVPTKVSVSNESAPEMRQKDETYYWDMACFSVSAANLTRSLLLQGTLALMHYES
ncbi:hypothetical protein H1R20_g12548, partial [Candolleomyces eurysporus]